jgi:CO/xanthine dehydrogenase FAD-binding subunit
MSDLAYVRARSLGEAIVLLNEPGVRNRVLAGGTDLVNQHRGGQVSCDRLVDVAHVPELRAIEADGRLTIGAAVTHAEIVESEVLRQKAPLLVRACRQIGSPQIRNIATLGGNVVTGVNQTNLPQGSLIRAFTFDLPPADSRASYLRIGRRQALSIARLSVAVMGALNDAGTVSFVRIVPGAAAARFRRVTAVEDMLVGQQPTPRLAADAGRRMADHFMAESGGRWSAPYKRQTIAVLTERALTEVMDL